MKKVESSEDISVNDIERLVESAIAFVRKEERERARKIIEDEFYNIEEDHLVDAMKQEAIKKLNS